MESVEDLTNVCSNTTKTVGVDASLLDFGGRPSQIFVTSLCRSARVCKCNVDDATATRCHSVRP